MDELSVTTIIGLGGFAIGLVLGAVVQRTNFCTMGGISDLVLMGDGRRLRAWVLATAVAIIGTQFLALFRTLDANPILTDKQHRALHGVGNVLVPLQKTAAK